MRKFHVSVLALLVAATTALADPPKLDIPANVQAPTTGYLTVKPTTDAASVVFISPDLDPFPSTLLTDKTVFVVPVRGVQAGTYTVWAIGASKTGEQAVVQFTVVVGTTPAPPPSPKPGPTPTPNAEAPIKQAGLSVMILEDTSKRSGLSQGQRDVLFGNDVRSYLRSKTIKNSDSPVGAWNIWPNDADVSAAPKVWQDAFNRGKQKATSYPWVMVSNGKTGFEGPLPASTTPTDFIKSVAPFEVNP